MDQLQDIDLDIIWSGKSSSSSDACSSNHYQELRKLFLDKLNIPSTGEIILRTEIDQCATEHELVSLLRPNFQWLPLPDTAINRFKKCGETSTKLREKANVAYKHGDLKQAMRGYNLALMFAPVTSSEMGFAFANRSALLVQLNQFRTAVSDIDSALKNNFPENLREKLEIRRQKCISHIGINDQKDAQESATKRYLDETFFTLNNPNAKIPNAERWVKIDYREDRGRRLVTTEAVPAGTVVLIDKPLVSVIDNLLGWDPWNCHWCYKPLLAGLPCKLCTFTIYCDELCRQKSCHGNHKHEHNYLSYLQPLTAPNVLLPPIIAHKELQSLRLLAIVGSTEMYKLFLRYQETGHIFPQESNEIAGFDPESGIYDCSSYRSMYHLISHGLRGGNIKEKLDDIFKSMFLARMLKETCPDFFGGVEINLEFENFVASLILRHLGNIKYNAISVSKLEEKSHCSGTSMSVSFATAVNPLISLCNHSCAPNAAPIKKFHMLETALVTLNCLQAGEEICITYRPLFTNTKITERRQYLGESYNFLCTCVACLNNWSIKSIKKTDQLESAIQLKSAYCSDCQGKGMGLPQPCETCLRHHLQQIAKIDNFENELYAADEELQKGHFMNAIEILRPCLNYFSTHYSPCYSLSHVSLDLFKRALVRLANQAENFRPLF